MSGKSFNNTLPIEYIQVEGDRWTKKNAEVIVETPVSIAVNGDVWLTFMCTPVDLEALAVGFLFNEGIIKSAKELVQVRVCEAGDNIDVWLEHSAEKPDKWRRTSGCTGGMTSVDVNQLPFVAPDGLQKTELALTPTQVNALVETLFDAQDLYRRTGGVHTSVLTDGSRVFAVGEDIGRHNTLDKLAGQCLLNDIKMSDRVVLTTGRISSEMIQKAARVGVAILISRTSPSSLSIRLAERWGITLIGYARRNRFIVYTHPKRILIEKNNQQINQAKDMQTTLP
jgi:FdhD protein